jgi:hypothetical protein
MEDNAAPHDGNDASHQDTRVSMARDTHLPTKTTSGVLRTAPFPKTSTLPVSLPRHLVRRPLPPDIPPSFTKSLNDRHLRLVLQNPLASWSVQPRRARFRLASRSRRPLVRRRKLLTSMRVLVSL